MISESLKVKILNGFTKVRGRIAPLKQSFAKYQLEHIHAAVVMLYFAKCSKKFKISIYSKF